MMIMSDISMSIMTYRKCSFVFSALFALTVALMSVSVSWAAMGGLINGVVTAPDGGLPPAGTIVKLFEPGRDTVMGQAQVDEVTGEFSLGPVPNGVYVLKAIPPMGSGLTQSKPRMISVLGNSISSLTLKLTDPQFVGVVTKPDGTTPVSATVKVLLGNGVSIQAVEAPSGDFMIGGIPAGSYALRAFPILDEPFWRSDLEPVTAMSTTQTVTLTLSTAQLWGAT
ncbi:MAG: carboxypeptidase-like regulatory domain-containing protein, partial [Chloroflexota bacterium]